MTRIAGASVRGEAAPVDGLSAPCRGAASRCHRRRRMSNSMSQRRCQLAIAQHNKAKFDDTEILGTVLEAVVQVPHKASASRFPFRSIALPAWAQMTEAELAELSDESSDELAMPGAQHVDTKPQVGLTPKVSGKVSSSGRSSDVGPNGSAGQLSRRWADLADSEDETLEASRTAGARWADLIDSE